MVLQWRGGAVVAARKRSLAILEAPVSTEGWTAPAGSGGLMSVIPEGSEPGPAGPLLPELQPGEDVWAMLALPSLTLLATDRRLLSRAGDRVETWEYGAITQVGPAGIEGDVVISFQDGHRPLVVHAKGDETAMQALTVIGLLVAQSGRLNRLHAASR